MKKMVLFVVVLVLFCNSGLSAQTNFFWNVSGGLTLSQDSNNIDSGFSGFGGLVSAHIGIESLNLVSFETGIDFLLNNNIISSAGRGVVNKIEYNSLDIPLMVKFFLPVFGNFALQPSLGLFFTYQILDQSKVEIAPRFITGIQMGISGSYNLDEKSKLFLGTSIKYDMEFTNTWDFPIKRMTVPIFIGYERKI